MRHDKPVAANEAVPLFVDVDGTLTHADVSLESFVRVARSSFWALLALLATLMRSRAAAKAFAARRDPLDPTRLPYRREVLDLVAAAKAEGRPVVLASASHWRNVRRIAQHLRLHDPVIATNAWANLKGEAKLAAIRERIGADTPFDYVGDCRSDVCLWLSARRGWTVGHKPISGGVQTLSPRRQTPSRAIIRAMRPHQWAKNALVLVPALTSGLFVDAATLLTAGAAALFMSLIASAIYLLNDLLDIDADRAHRTKRHRPLARGDLTIPTALVVAVMLAAAGLIGGWLLGGARLTFWLIAYVVLTSAYSVRLKSVMVGDAVILASLYTIRIWIGGVAIGVTISFWLLLFSVFLFLSLAYLKRYIEMRHANDPERLLTGRGYVGGDHDVVMASGVSSGMVAVLVLALFAHEPEATAYYAAPEFLLLLCLPLIYWLNRIWMMARRGEVEGDPVAFAIKDVRSLAIGGLMVAIFLMALWGAPDFL